MDAALFGRRNTRRSTAIGIGGPLSYFDKDEGWAVAHDEIELACRAAQLAFEQQASCTLKIFQRTCLIEVALALPRRAVWRRALLRPRLLATQSPRGGSESFFRCLTAFCCASSACEKRAAWSIAGEVVLYMGEQVP